MKNIIYLTTSIKNDDYEQYIKYWKIKPNPSNQNFHNKLIRSIAINNKINVISVRPYSRSLCSLKGLKKETKEDNNITWNYLKISRGNIFKILSSRRQILKLIKHLLKKDEDNILITDTINLGISIYLKSIIKNHYPNLKIIGVITDSPSNISNTSKSYTTYILNACKNLDGYIALTSQLNDLYNKNNKSNIIIEGVIEDNTKLINNKRPDYEYFFFGGTLLPKFGIYNLIEAFKEIYKKYPRYYLVIAGHHVDEKMFNNAIKDCPNIKYLSTISYKEVLYYEKYALCNINPRPFNEDLDKFSIPSKTLEYLTSGNITISTKNTKLAKYFPTEILWSKSESKEDLYDALEKVILNDPSLNKEFALKAKKIALDNFSKEAVNKKINDFIDTYFINN